MAHAIGSQSIRDRFTSLDTTDSQYASVFVDQLLDAACTFQFSDIHLQPKADKLNIGGRMDGVLQEVDVFDRGQTADIIRR